MERVECSPPAKRSRGVIRGGLAGLALVGLWVGAGHARKATPTAVVSSVGDVEINWTRGLVIASRGASADLRAPTATIASVKAVRTAREKATADAAAAAAALPWVGAKSSKSSMSELAATLLIDAVVLKRTRTSDGSAIVSVGIPIESVRRARAGQTAQAIPSARSDVTALVVTVGSGAKGALNAEAIGSKIWPAIGWAVAVDKLVYSGPVLFARRRPGAEVLGKRPLTVAATAVSNGVISVAPEQKAALESAIGARALVVVLDQ